MPTADSVKTKLQGLIDTANAKTGESDTTLTEAVQSLAEGYGSGSGGNTTVASNFYMTEVTPEADLNSLTITHNLGTVDILLAVAWVQTLGDTVPTANVALGKYWAKSDVPVRISQTQSGENYNPVTAWNINYGMAANGGNTSLAYWDSVTDENTFTFNRAGSAQSVFMAGVTYTVIIIANGAKDGAALARSIVDRSITEYSDDEVTRVADWMFYQCVTLKKFDAPALTRVDSSAFRDCSKLTEFNAPNLTTVGASAFQGCLTLPTIDLSNLTTINNATSFSYCYKFTEVSLPKCNLSTSGGGVFLNCTGLTRADLWIATKLTSQFFRGCTALETVIIRTPTVCTLAHLNAFTNTPIESGTGYVYVPSALVEDYKVATNWVTYADQIRAIEDYPEITDKEESE